MYAVRGTDTVLVSTIKLKRLEVLTLFEPAVLPQRNIECAQLRHITALCIYTYMEHRCSGARGGDPKAIGPRPQQGGFKYI